MKTIKKCVYLGLPLVGILFYLYYVNIAAIDMIYSDYIRLINSYLPDVWNPDKFFVADLLTRIPVNYLVRGINVTFLHYSVTFERVLGVLSFGASALVIGWYCRKQSLQLGWYAAIMVFVFSLNKWEMIYNSTGWVHFLAFACFFYHYALLDRVYKNGASKSDFVKLSVLPGLITIFVAGPYCAVYAMTLLIAYGFIWLQNVLCHEKRGNVSGRQILFLMIQVIWPLFLYIWSNSQAVYEHAGATDASLFGTFLTQPEFFLKFLLKSFASIVFGVELVTEHMSGLPDLVLYLVGAGVLASYFVALGMNFFYGIYKRTIFPLMLLAGGGMNHLVVMASRWIFLKDTYGMSSRYALQFQVGILGIFLTFALAWKEMRGTKNGAKTSAIGKTGAGRFLVCGLSLCVTAVVLAGNLMTTKAELEKAPYRKLHSLEVKEILLDFENQDDETLKQNLEYNKPRNREALEILKENGLNIFKNN